MFSFAKKLVDRLEGHDNTSESLESDAYFKNALEINNKGYGLRILKVEPHSEAHAKGLESWFDYIIRINNHELPFEFPASSNYNYSINEDGSLNYFGDAAQEQVSMVDFDSIRKELSRIVSNEHGSHEVVFDVWNAKGGVIRQVCFTLKQDNHQSTSESNDLSGSFPISKGCFESLGFVCQSQHLSTSTYVWRILTTHPGSPAFLAQLVPYSDYIIGCEPADLHSDKEPKGLLTKGGQSLLSNVVLTYYNKHISMHTEDSVPITLFVYNHDYDVLRPVTVNLSRSWGTGQNKGILGCDVGYGLLHRIPQVIGKFESHDIIDDVLFEDHQTDQYQAQAYVSPSKIVSTGATYTQDTTEKEDRSTFVPLASAPPQKPPGSKKKKQHRVEANLDDLNAYMNEELEKSKNVDTQSSSVIKEGNVPPPPKGN